MPLYEYECDACGGRFEVIQKFSETTETCRRCGKGPVRRLMSSPAIQFKGTGWYITDYAQKSRSGESSSGSDAPAEKKTDSTKTDTATTSTKSDTAASPSSTPTGTTKD